MTNYKPGDKVHPKPEMIGTVIGVEHQANNCSIVCVDWGNDNIAWAAPDWLTPAEQDERITQLIEAASRYHKLMNTPLYKADEDHHEQIQKANSDLSSALKPFQK